MPAMMEGEGGEGGVGMVVVGVVSISSTTHFFSLNSQLQLICCHGYGHSSFRAQLTSGKVCKQPSLGNRPACAGSSEINIPLLLWRSNKEQYLSNAGRAALAGLAQPSAGLSARLMGTLFQST